MLKVLLFLSCMAVHIRSGTTWTKAMKTAAKSVACGAVEGSAGDRRGVSGDGLTATQREPHGQAQLFGAGGHAPPLQIRPVDLAVVYVNWDFCEYFAGRPVEHVVSQWSVHVRVRLVERVDL